MHVKSNIDARSRNYCCLGKEISIVYSKNVSGTLSNQLAKRMRHITMSSAACPALQYFPTLSHKRHDFRKIYIYIEYKMYGFIFSAIFVWNIYSRKYQRDITNAYRSSRKVPVILVKAERKFNFLDRFSTNAQISDSIKLRPVGAELERQTDMTKPTVALFNCAKAPKQHANY